MTILLILTLVVLFILIQRDSEKVHRYMDVFSVLPSSFTHTLESKILRIHAYQISSAQVRNYINWFIILEVALLFISPLLSLFILTLVVTLYSILR